jgi:hypothetical protein
MGSMAISLFSKILYSIIGLSLYTLFNLSETLSLSLINLGSLYMFKLSFKIWQANSFNVLAFYSLFIGYSPISLNVKKQLSCFISILSTYENIILISFSEEGLPNYKYTEDPLIIISPEIVDFLPSLSSIPAFPPFRIIIS